MVSKAQRTGGDKQATDQHSPPTTDHPTSTPLQVPGTLVTQAQRTPTTLTPSNVQRLQRTIGNRRVGNVLHRQPTDPLVQRKGEKGGHGLDGLEGTAEYETLVGNSYGEEEASLGQEQMVAQDQGEVRSPDIPDFAFDVVNKGAVQVLGETVHMRTPAVEGHFRIDTGTDPHISPGDTIGWIQTLHNCTIYGDYYHPDTEQYLESKVLEWWKPVRDGNPAQDFFYHDSYVVAPGAGKVGCPISDAPSDGMDMNSPNGGRLKGFRGSATFTAHMVRRTPGGHVKFYKYVDWGYDYRVLLTDQGYEMEHCDTTVTAMGDGSGSKHPVMEGGVANDLLPTGFQWVQGGQGFVAMMPGLDDEVELL